MMMEKSGHLSSTSSWLLPLTIEAGRGPSTTPPPHLLATTPSEQASPPEDLSVSPPPFCAGCNLRIVDKFYLSAVDSKWHTSCLKCSECGMELGGHISCYERDGLILCKQDYIRIYGGASRMGAGLRQCARCLMTIGSSELVMKAKCFLYHVECFRCVVCDVALIKGDLFGMFDTVVYCQAHYHQQQQQQENQLILSDPEFGSHQNFYSYEENSSSAFSGPPSGGGWSTPTGEPDFPSDNNNSIPSSKKKRGRRKREMSEEEASRGCFPYLDPASAMAEKTKRARTSFKHHQLRIMKSHFQMNQNPDSRELKELASKTGLDKKVLQVWFQNARAKWRRMNNSQGMSSCPSTSALDNSPLGDSNHPFGGGSL